MINDDWIMLCESFEKSQQIIGKIDLCLSKGLVLGFKNFSEAADFEEEYQSKAWGKGVCCNYHTTNNLNFVPEVEKLHLYGYVVVFDHFYKQNLLDLIEYLTNDFKRKELAEINKLFSKLDWLSLRDVGDGHRYLRIGVDINSLNESLLEELIRGYQNVMGELFPKAKKLTTRQVKAILRASQSFYFADLGT